MSIEFLTERVGYIPGAVNIGVVRGPGDRFVLVDAGLNETSARKAIRAVAEIGGTIDAIITTHAHADHFGANATVVKRTGARVYAPAIDEAIIRHPILQPALLYGGADPPPPLRGRFLLAEPSPVDDILPADSLEIEDVPVDVVGLPGHSPNQVGLVIDDVFFSADVVLPDHVLDKYRMPYLFSVRDHLDSLEIARSVEARWVVPGHGDVSPSIGQIIERNRSLVDQIADRLTELSRDPADATELLARLLRDLEAPVTDLVSYFLLQPTVFAFLSYLHERGEVEAALVDCRVVWWRA